MKKQKYFNMFLFYLGQLPQEEAYRVVSFFSEIVDDKIEAGISEDEALNQYGDCREFARKILKDCYNIEAQFKEYTEEETEEPAVVDENLNTYTAAMDNIAEIQVNSKAVDIDVIPSLDDMIHVGYMENESFTKSFRVQGTVFVVDFMSNASDGILGGMFKGKKKDNLPNITIEVPVKYTGNIVLNNENASIRIANLAGADNLLCTSKNGHIRVIDTNAASLTAKTSNFRITVTGVTILKELNTMTNNGSIDLNKVSAEAITCKTTKSDISLKKATAKNMLQASTTDSYIEFVEISGNVIDLKTSNGRISGTIAGNIDEYSITSKSSGGKSNLPNIPFGVKRLSAVTSKENIYITFQDPS
ncbi:MAG: DUF4097 family beta strand repeat protein [Oscillospiraceae bacterium]|nr:DUF4097 family beta strand repeat protein [Oscillospiraceae bacterium]